MKIIESNGVFRVAEFQGSHDTLPQGVYMVKFDPREGFSLARKENFKLPSKIYGDHSITKRWLTSYRKNSEKNMGIILSGLKGSGKTITAQQFCIESGMPVIMLTEAWHGPEFTDFITKFQNVILFIDEFEKIYSKQEESNDLLGLMDGNYPTRFIFLLTVNDFSINPFLINRLGRIKYRKHYDSLDPEVLDAVLDDLLINQAHRESVYLFFKRINMCTFDLVVNLIKEMNLFDQDAVECGKHLNLQAEKKMYEVYERVDGKEVYQGNVKLYGDQTKFDLDRNVIPSGLSDEEAGNAYDLDVDLTNCDVSFSDGTTLIVSKDGDYSIKLKEQRYSSAVFAI